MGMTAELKSNSNAAVAKASLSTNMKKITELYLIIPSYLSSYQLVGVYGSLDVDTSYSVQAGPGSMSVGFDGHWEAWLGARETYLYGARVHISYHSISLSFS